jgi:hypothetical protein
LDLRIMCVFPRAEVDLSHICMCSVSVYSVCVYVWALCLSPLPRKKEVLRTKPTGRN